MSFWSEVRELRAATLAYAKAGHGRRSLIMAVQDAAIGKDTIQSAPTKDVMQAAQQAGAQQISQQAGQQVPDRMTAAEFRQFLASGGKVRGAKG